MRSVDLEVDVTEAAGLGEPALVSLTVTAPDELPDDPLVCFAKPGAGYSRRYFTEDLPGPGHGTGAQAAWHAARGWIFVSVDHLGVGDSSRHDPLALAFTPLAGASEAAEGEVRRRLAAGTLLEGLGPVGDPLTIGIGQSMGGALTVVQQGRFHSYDGIGVLGYSPLRTQPPTGPSTRAAIPWTPRDTPLADGVVTNAAALAEAAAGAAPGAPAMAWGFHHDDVDPAVVARDMDDYPGRHGDVPPWGSADIPATAALWCAAPGATLTEAASVRVPVLVALGERDVLTDPLGEPRAYHSAPSVDLFVCPRMAHMHNFAGTRELLWHRVETWAAWVAAARPWRSRPEAGAAGP